MKKEQRESKTSEEQTSVELGAKINEVKSEVIELKSEMSQMRCEVQGLGAKMEAITNILSTLVKPVE